MVPAAEPGWQAAATASVHACAEHESGAAGSNPIRTPKHTRCPHQQPRQVRTPAAHLPAALRCLLPAAGAAAPPPLWRQSVPPAHACGTRQGEMISRHANVARRACRHGPCKRAW